MSLRWSASLEVVGVVSSGKLTTFRWLFAHFGAILRYRRRINFLRAAFPWIRRLDRDRAAADTRRCRGCVYRCVIVIRHRDVEQNKRATPSPREMSSLLVDIGHLSCTFAAAESARHLVYIAAYISAFFPRHFNTISTK